MGSHRVVADDWDAAAEANEREASWRAVYAAIANRRDNSDMLRWAVPAYGVAAMGLILGFGFDAAGWARAGLGLLAMFLGMAVLRIFYEASVYMRIDALMLRELEMHLLFGSATPTDWVLLNGSVTPNGISYARKMVYKRRGDLDLVKVFYPSSAQGVWGLLFVGGSALGLILAVTGLLSTNEGEGRDMVIYLGMAVAVVILLLSGVIVSRVMAGETPGNTDPSELGGGIGADELDALDALLELKRQSMDRFFERRRIEWRVAIAVWTSFSLMANAILRLDSEAITERSLVYIMIGTSVFVSMHLLWGAMNGARGARSNRDAGIQLDNTVRGVLGLDQVKPRKYHWVFAHLWPAGITLLLGAGVVFVAWVRMSG